jgi:hypothetical protein
LLRAAIKKTLMFSPLTLAVTMNNTAATPIAGAIANLAEGSTFTVDTNTFKSELRSSTGADLN